MRFTSGIAFHTVRLSNALAASHDVCAVLMRQLLPTWLYPGRARVGKKLTSLEFDGSIDVYDGVDWYWVPSLLGGVRTLARHRPDAVIFHWWTGAVGHSYAVLAAMARLLGAQNIFELHELQDPGEAEKRFAASYVRLVWRILDRLVDGFVIHSDADRSAVVERFRPGARPLAVIPVGSYDHYGDLASIPPRRDAPADSCNLLFFGVIRAYKGLQDLVAAFNSLPNEVAERFWLTVVGETWEGFNEPARLIAESPHRERITFVNSYVTDDELAGYVAGADVVVCPYHRGSASGPLHVAMSAGRPVIVTDVGGLAHAAREYGGAIFVSPRDSDAIVEALARAEALRGERFADAHSWENAAVLYERLLERLEQVDDGGGGGRGQLLERQSKALGRVAR